MKTKRSFLTGPQLTFAILILSLLVFSFIGCSSGDKAEADKTDELATLPDDTGDKTLLDTTVTEQPQDIKKPEQQVTQKPPEKKAEPKPEPKPQPKPAEKPMPKEPEYVTTVLLPENSGLEVEMLTYLSTDSNQVGDPFRVMVLGPMEKGEPSPFPAGTMLEGVVADMADGREKGTSAWFKLKFTNFVLPGEKGIPIEGYVATDDGDGVIKAGSKTGTVAKDAGIGAIAGGILGAVTGKKDEKTEGAVKGAVVGAAAGGVLGAILHKDRVTLKSGNKMDVILLSPVIQKKLKKEI